MDGLHVELGWWNLHAKEKKFVLVEIRRGREREEKQGI